MTNLLIVESPAKAKTINKYLGNDFKVVASFGHVRDLPATNGSVLPNEDFAMKYEISSKSAKYVSEIVKLAKTADNVYLATDPDREGESIAWHVAQILKEKKAIKKDSLLKRVTFNEITQKAVLNAVAHPRSIDEKLVDAQQARRALDYLVGFTLSPLLWRKLPGCRSAGRVQSVALRLICEREEEIELFVTQEYWDIKLHLLNSSDKKFIARLTHIDGNKLEKFSIVTEMQAREIEERLQKVKFSITNIEKKQQKRNPPAPFITSSLQQEAARKLGFSAKKTMQVAQKLYEGIEFEGETKGLITYMRTDGVNISTEATEEIRKLIGNKFGKDYLPRNAIMYKTKAKNAQEAHEAIRPTDINLLPEKATHVLDKDQARLYELIWQRTVACQMESVLIDMVVATLESEKQVFAARATGSTIAFDGFYRLYKEGKDDEQEEKSDVLPPLNIGEQVRTQKVQPEQHFTEPPPRYSEASLVKKLEELGIGRPSTYASIISVLQDRKYVTLDKKRFIPSVLGRLLVLFLTGFFSKYVGYDFTAKLEDDLDKVAVGDFSWKSLMKDFWEGFNTNIANVEERKITEVIEYVESKLDHYLFGDKDSEEYAKNKKCPSCASGTLTLKLGKYGAFLACNKYPECTLRRSIAKSEDVPEELPEDSKDGANLAPDANSRVLGVDPSGSNIYIKKGPYGWYLQIGEQKDKKDKPKRSPLPSGISPSDIRLELALKILSLPAEIGAHPDSGEKMVLGIGRYGPYIKYQNKFFSIPKTIEHPLEITTDQAIIIVNQGKKVKE